MTESYRNILTDLHVHSMIYLFIIKAINPDSRKFSLHTYIHTYIEWIRLGRHKPKLRGHLTNVTKIHVFQSGKLREKSSVLSRCLKVDKELDDRTSSDRVFQTRAPANGKARSPTLDRFDVGMANMSDNHDCSRCLDGRSLMLRRSTDRYARASPCRHRYTRTAIL